MAQSAALTDGPTAQLVDYDLLHAANSRTSTSPTTNRAQVARSAHTFWSYAVVTTTMIRLRLRRPFDCLPKVVKVTVT